MSTLNLVSTSASASTPSGSISFVSGRTFVGEALGRIIRKMEQCPVGTYTYSDSLGGVLRCFVVHNDQRVAGECRNSEVEYLI
jgi:hypothetical protein